MQTVILSQFPDLRPLAVENGLAPELIEQYSGMVDLHVGGAVAYALIGFVLVVGIEFATMLIGKRRQKERE